MSARNPDPRNTEWPIDDVPFRVYVADPFSGERVVYDCNFEVDPWSRAIVGQSIARAGDRELVVETLREYRSADGSCSDDLLDWASQTLGVSPKTILRWLKNGPPPVRPTPDEFIELDRCKGSFRELWRRMNHDALDHDRRDAA